MYSRKLGLGRDWEQAAEGGRRGGLAPGGDSSVEVSLQSDKVGVCGKQQHLSNCRWVVGSRVLDIVIPFVTLNLLVFVAQINVLVL